MVPARNKAKRLSSVNNSIKKIYHHHHHSLDPSIESSRTKEVVLVFMFQSEVILRI